MGSGSTAILHVVTSKENNRDQMYLVNVLLPVTGLGSAALLLSFAYISCVVLGRGNMVYKRLSL